MNRNQRAMKQRERGNKIRRKENAMKLQRLLYLSKLDHKEMNAKLMQEQEMLRSELWKGNDAHLRIVEVLYKGEVIYTGSHTEVARKCKKAKGTLVDLLRKGTPDKQGRVYRNKD